MSESPPHFDDIVNDLVSELGLSQMCTIDLSAMIDDEALQASTMITLAGYLLDYSVAYTLINESGVATQVNGLGGRELSLVTTAVVCDTKRYLLFQVPLPTCSDFRFGQT